MRRGESNETSDNLDKLDLLNLRLNLPSTRFKRSEKGSGDFRKTKEKNVCTQTKSIDNFLLPPRKRSTSLLPHSTSAGDVGNFPFKVGPSGNFKVHSGQVVFESRKLSVLVAHPEKAQLHHLAVNKRNMAYGSGEFTKNSAMDAILSQACGISGLGSIIGDTPVRSTNKVSSEYESKQTSEILDPELNLCRLGYTGNENIDWNKVVLPDKKDLYLELCRRITNKKNADCKVHIDGEEFNCHLIVLQCYSELFDGYIAIKKVEIPSEKCSAASFSFIYDWMLSEEQSYKYLNRDNVLDIFNAAKYLKIKDLVEQCWAFVDNIEVFNEDTAFLLYIDAKVKNVEEVRELMIPRIQDFFLILVSSQNWLELSVEDVKTLLSSNYIKINCEMEIFMSAVRWLKYDWSNRDKYKYDILSCVRFGNIAPWQLVDVKRNPENPEFMELAKDSAICKLIDDGLAFVIIKYWYGQENDDFQHWNSVLGLQEPPSRNWSGIDKTYFTYREFLIYLDQYRRNQLIEKSKPKLSHDKKVGSASAGTMMQNEPVPSMEDFLSKKKVKAFMPFSFVKKDEEVELNTRKMFSASQNSLALSSLNSFLSPQPKKLLVESSLFLADRETILVFGGVDPYMSYGEKSNRGDKILRYVPDTNSWDQVGTMPEPRSQHSAAFLKGRIYVAGGVDPRDDGVRGKERVVDTVWSFDPASRSWYSETSLGARRRNFGLVAIQQRMYAVGGCDENLTALASIERFDPQKGVWRFLAPMKYARAGLACAKYRNYIWAAGGTADLRKNAILDAVECYDVKTNQWTVIKKLNSPRCFGRFFVTSDTLYLIGGASTKYQDFKSTSSVPNVDVWNASTMSWNTLAALTLPRHGHAVAYVGTQIIIMGGVTSIYLRCLSNIECYCWKRGAWVKGITDLPCTLSGHAAITLPPANLIS